MMLRFSFDLDQEADAIEQAVAKVLEEGYRTIDIMSDERHRSERRKWAIGSQIAFSQIPKEDGYYEK